jgi:hypothetical protein
MNDFKSVQDLIVKAAIYDGISTTISPTEISGDVLKITFSKGNRKFTTGIELHNKFRNPEEVALDACKHALHGLMWSPYDEIECREENNE